MKENIQQDPEYSIVVLCYGAGDSIPDFVESMTRVLLQNSIHDYQLVLVGNYVENKRIDQTAKIVLELAKNNLRIISVAEKKDGMMGWDMRSGLAVATGKYISVIDGDGQMPVEDLARVYQKIKNENYDLVKTFGFELISFALTKGNSNRNKPLKVLDTNFRQTPSPLVVRTVFTKS